MSAAFEEKNLVGQKVGAYLLERRIGRGGFADVYLARHESNPRWKVAIKVMRTEGRTPKEIEEYRRRFETEAQVCFQYNLPRVARILEPQVRELDGRPCQVMEYVAGGSLQDWIERIRNGMEPPVSEKEAIRVGIEIAESLAALHEKGLVHRDVKPSNILLDAERHALLSDLGLVQTTRSRFRREMAGSLAEDVGDPLYRPPEQDAGRPSDFSSDVYMWGATLFELLTLRKYRYAEGQRVRDFRPDISPWLDEVIAVALRRDPAERFQSMEAVLASLRQRRVVDAPRILKPPPRGSLQTGEISPPTSASPAAENKASGQVVSKPRWPRSFLIGLPIAIALFVAIGAVAARWAAYSGAPSEMAPTLTTERGLRSPTSSTVFPLSKASADMTTPADQSTPSKPTPSPAPTAIPTPTPAPTPTPTLAIKKNALDGALLAHIPKGSFLMGLTAGQRGVLEGLCAEEGCIELYEASTPAHEVEVDAFWIYQTEVSNGMYARCVAAGACTPPGKRSSETHHNYYGNPVYDRYPVTRVSWSQANAYCQWAGGRLPTSAEWEYAARGTDGRLFPWGDTPPTPQLANVEDFYHDLLPVDALPDGRSPFGLYNMTGNVWEWVQDWYSATYYASHTDWRNPKGPLQGDVRQGVMLKVGRGGGYWIKGALGSPAIQDWENPSSHGLGIGFRCVQEDK